jgi:hypothetical protein
MCEFVADDIDMKKLSDAEKKKLREHLEERKKQLEERARKLGQAIQEIK